MQYYYNLTVFNAFRPKSLNIAANIIMSVCCVHGRRTELRKRLLFIGHEPNKYFSPHGSRVKFSDIAQMPSSSSEDRKSQIENRPRGRILFDIHIILYSRFTILASGALWLHCRLLFISLRILFSEWM